jgi:hypothetical protein
MGGSWIGLLRAFIFITTACRYFYCPLPRFRSTRSRGSLQPYENCLKSGSWQDQVSIDRCACLGAISRRLRVWLLLCEMLLAASDELLSTSQAARGHRGCTSHT